LDRITATENVSSAAEGSAVDSDSDSGAASASYSGTALSVAADSFPLSLPNGTTTSVGMNRIIVIKLAKNRMLGSFHVEEWFRNLNCFCFIDRPNVGRPIRLLVFLLCSRSFGNWDLVLCRFDFLFLHAFGIAFLYVYLRFFMARLLVILTSIPIIKHIHRSLIIELKYNLRISIEKLPAYHREFVLSYK